MGSVEVVVGPPGRQARPDVRERGEQRLVQQLSGTVRGPSCTIAASSTMSRDVLTCRPDELLREVLNRMKERKVKNIPVVNEDSRPVGVLHARDILLILLGESETEEASLQDYVMVIGY